MLKKDLQKEYTQVQKILDLAQVRKYDTKELFKYDLIKFAYLFDEEGLLNRPQKKLADEGMFCHKMIMALL